MSVYLLFYIICNITRAWTQSLSLGGQEGHRHGLHGYKELQFQAFDLIFGSHYLQGWEWVQERKTMLLNNSKVVDHE